jgi:hypothetical protein
METVKKYKLLYEERDITGEVEYWEYVYMTLPEILREINRDRSGEWIDYDETDWQEGLKHFTEYTLVPTKRKWRVE